VRSAAAAALALCAALSATCVLAHPLAPAVLEMREDATGRVAVVWKAPLQAPDAGLRPLLPGGCELLAPPVARSEDAARVVETEMRCDRGLVGARIALDGLATSRAAVLLRLRLRDGRLVRHALRPGDDGFVVPARLGSLSVWWGYLRLGVTHILGGPDHLLFLLGLFALAPSRRRLAAMVTAFTAGHAVTLSYASLGGAVFPAAAVEAVIALTIVVLALELTRGARSAPSLLQRRPWALTAGFGLLHGLGFASALAEVGLPAGDVVTALLGFNCGVEAGQIAFVLALAVAWRPLARLLARWREHRVALAYAIGSIAACLLIERTLLC
jgi:hydrogenase/urease accessory protein HupE